MKIIQSCWFNDVTKLDGGWLSTKYHLMSWCLSSISYKRFYPELSLITDFLGKEILIDQLGLPYNNYSIEHEYSKPIIQNLWVLRKIHAYSIQTEPFIHVDGDTYLFKPFDDNLINSPLIAQNLEFDHPYYVKGYDEIKKYCHYIPSYLNQKLDGKISAVNAGILGGNEFLFFQLFKKEVDNFLNKNENVIINLDSFCFNISLEQLFFKKLADYKGLNIAYQMNEEIGYPFNYQLDRFWDLPNDCNYIHLMNYKQNPTLCEFLSQRLFVENPDLHEKAILLSRKLDNNSMISTFVINEIDDSRAPFYRLNEMLQTLGVTEFFKLPKIDFFELENFINGIKDTNEKEVLNDLFQFELQRFEFINSLPNLIELSKFKKEHSRLVNLNLKNAAIDLLKVKIGMHCQLIESKWSWAEKNEFQYQRENVNYSGNLKLDSSYFLCLVFVSSVSMQIKEQIVDPLIAIILGTIKESKNLYVEIGELVENVVLDLDGLNSTIELSDLKKAIISKIRYLLYQGVLEF